VNYLAHFYLAENRPGLVIGGFLADFVKGPLKGAYPEDIELGMQLHRKIDSWSDNHPAIKNFKELLPLEFNRYAGIIADVLGDHEASVLLEIVFDVITKRYLPRTGSVDFRKND